MREDGDEEDLQMLPRGFFRPQAEQLVICIGDPGSGKTTYIRNLIRNSKTNMNLEEEHRPRLLVVSYGTAAVFWDEDEDEGGDDFDDVFKVEDVLNNPSLVEKVKENSSTVIVLDDLVITKQSELLTILKLYFEYSRHGKLTVIAAIHTVTHIPGIAGLLKFAALITLHPCFANILNLRRLRHVFEWDEDATRLLYKELRRMHKLRRQRHTFDAILIYVQDWLAVLNVLAKPLTREDHAIAADPNLLVSLVPKDMEGSEAKEPSQFVLMPLTDYRKLRETKDSSSNKRNALLALFSESEKVKVEAALADLASRPNTKLNFNTLVARVSGKKGHNHIDLCRFALAAAGRDRTVRAEVDESNTGDHSKDISGPPSSQLREEDTREDFLKLLFG